MIEPVGGGYGTCPVCSSTLKAASRDMGAGPHFTCPHCGIFAISDLLASDREDWADRNTKTKLKHLLFEHRLKGAKAVMLATVTSGVSQGKSLVALDEFLSRYPRTPLEYFDRALENLGRSVNHPTANLPLSNSLYRGMFSEPAEARTMLHQLVDMGYLSNPAPSQYSISPRGWLRISELKTPGRDSRQAFVAMWFDASHAHYFTDGIKPAIEADGVTKAMRIDGKEHNDHIDDQIIAEIRRSRYVVADFRAHRAGVYFEAGFALGLGLPVIWTCHKCDLKDAHFDTRQYNHIEYDTPEELKTRLLNRIRATVA